MKRHFFHVIIKDTVQDDWEILTDNHRFKLFWASFTNLPNIIEPQYQWIDYVTKTLGYEFEGIT